jgi:hypothetical protein
MQRMYLKTSIGQLKIRHLVMDLPDGEININFNNGAIVYKGRVLEQFSDILTYGNGVTQEDIENVKAIALALCDQAKLMQEIAKFK